MPLRTLVSSFILVMLMEFGDKTMFTAMCLSAQYRRPWLVLLATTSALAVSSIIGIIIGHLLQEALPVDIIVYLSGGLFILLGLNSLRLSCAEESAVSCSSSTFFSMFSLILLSELGDKSQVAILALAAESALPIPVFIGALAAFIVIDAIGVAFGGRIAARIPTRTVRRAAGIVFIAFGLLILLQII